MRLEFSKRALAEIAKANDWWLANRPDAPLLFDTELNEQRARRGWGRAFDFRRLGPHAGLDAWA